MLIKICLMNFKRRFRSKQIRNRYEISLAVTVHCGDTT